MPSERTPDIDWNEVARTALSSAVLAGLVSGALNVLARVLEIEMQPPPARNAAPSEDPEAETDEAAALLGVDREATESEICAALRAKLIETRAHPDHGGDVELARRLIAARDLLLEHVRERT